MTNSSIWSIDRGLSNATTLGVSGPENNTNEGINHIPKSFRVTRASLL